MSINLAEIQQKVDRLLYNIAEQNRKAYQLFYDPNPQDVSLPQLDENGNLVTVSIPNIAKIKKQMWDDVNAAIGLWNRTFYVDAVNGDDNNPGTQDAPFKTIKKAVDSVPIGGVGYIRLTDGAEYTVDYDMQIRHKIIQIVASYQNRAKLNIKRGNPFSFGDATYATIHKIMLANASLIFEINTLQTFRFLKPKGLSKS